MTACTHCETELPDGLKFCNKCGTPVAAARIEAAGTPCRRCHSVLTPNQRFCNKCGTPVASANVADAIDVELPAPPVEPAPAPEPAHQPGHVAAESAHELAHGAADAQGTRADTVVESPAAHAAHEMIAVETAVEPHDVPDVNAPSASDARAPDTAVAHAGQPDHAAPAVEETIVLPASAQPARPESGAVPQPIPPAATANDDTSAKHKIIAAGVAFVVACAGGAFWWHGRHASAPATPEPVAASTVPAVTANAASGVAGSGSVTASAVVATTPTDAPASAPIDTATAAAGTTSPASAPPVVTNAAPVSVPATPPAANAQQPSPFAKLQDDAPAPSEPAAIAEAPHSKPRPTPPARQSAAAPSAAPAVDGLLKRAQSALSRGQYDRAIATAESVLALEPGNRPAKTLIDKAKARQMDALRNNSSLE